MFLYPGFIHFPEIPLLEVRDVWIGIGDDVGRLLYRITRGIWGRNYVIVGINDYCYSLYGTLGTFTPRNLLWSTTSGSVVKLNTFSWDSGTMKLHQDPIRDWVIDSSTFGEGNYYAVSWGSDDVTAAPRGPWLEMETPPTTQYLDISWPRLQGRTGYGTITEVGPYTPATTYVTIPLTGYITVGCPSWQGYLDGESRVLYKTLDAYDDAHSMNVCYCFEDNPNNGFKWSARNNRYEYEGEDGLYYSPDPPRAESSWTITWEHDETTETVNLSWGGWKRGQMGEKDWICELARIV